MKNVLVLLLLHYICSNGLAENLNNTRRRMEMLNLQLVTDDSDHSPSRSRVEAVNDLQQREGHRAFNENSLDAKLRSLLAEQLLVGRLPKNLDEAQKRGKQKIFRTNEKLKIEPTDLQHIGNLDRLKKERESRSGAPKTLSLGLRKGHTSSYLNEVASLLANYREDHKKSYLNDLAPTKFQEGHSHIVDKDARTLFYNLDNVERIDNLFYPLSYMNNPYNSLSASQFYKQPMASSIYDNNNLMTRPSDAVIYPGNRQAHYTAHEHKPNEDFRLISSKLPSWDLKMSTLDDKDVLYENRDTIYGKRDDRGETVDRIKDRYPYYKGLREHQKYLHEKEASHNNRDVTYEKREDRDLADEKRDDSDVTYKKRDDRNERYNKQEDRDATHQKQDDKSARYEKRDDRDATYEKRDDKDARYKKQDNRDATYEKRDDRDVTYEKRDDRGATYEKRDDRDVTYEKRDDRDVTYEKRDDRDVTYEKRDDRGATYEKRDDRDVTYEKRDDRDAIYEKRDDRDAKRATSTYMQPYSRSRVSEQKLRERPTTFKAKL